jgi:putative hydrolase of the HAD superfamily
MVDGKVRSVNGRLTRSSILNPRSSILDPRDMLDFSSSTRAVLFDAVGTLMRPEPAVAEAYLAAARRLGLDGRLSEEQVERQFREAFARQEEVDREAGWATDEERERRRWQAIVAEVFGDAALSTALFDALWEHFADARHWAAIGAARMQLVAVREAGLVVGVASNFDARLRGILAALPELRVDDNVFVSSELGWRKPSVQFFRAIEERLGLKPQEITLVGDDVENDYEAARAAGWEAELWAE